MCLLSPARVLAHPGVAVTPVSNASAYRGASGLSLAALVSWLLAESLGAYMFYMWLGSGRAQRQAGAAYDGYGQNGGGRDSRGPDGVSGTLIVAHATLALAGFVSWLGFLAAGTPAVAWLAIGFLAPAIGLGVSTVTVWTPYPVRRPVSQARSPTPPAPETRRQDTPSILISNEMLDRVLASEALTGELVDELVEKLLAEPGQPPQVSRSWLLAPVVPILHGVLAIATFLLATLAAIYAVI